MLAPETTSHANEHLLRITNYTETSPADHVWVGTLTLYHRTHSPDCVASLLGLYPIHTWFRPRPSYLRPSVAWEFPWTQHESHQSTNLNYLHGLLAPGPVRRLWLQNTLFGSNVCGIPEPETLWPDDGLHKLKTPEGCSLAAGSIPQTAC